MFNLKQQNDMNHCSVRLWYNKQRVNAQTGLITLYLQIIVGSESDEVKLPLRWPAKHFDWNKRTLVPRSNNDEDYNVYLVHIERERNRYWSVVQNFINNDQNFTLSDIFRGVNYYRSGLMMCEYMKQSIRERQKTKKLRDKIKASTARVHTSSLTNLTNYLNGVDIPLTAVNDTFLEMYADHLKQTLQEGSVYVIIQNVKSYLSYAVRQKVKVNLDYKLYKISVEEEEALFLEDFELQQMFQLYHKNELKPELQQVLRSFLFACVTGLRVSDLIRWRKDWIQDNCIVFVPTKTRISKVNPKPIRVPIMPIAQQFINELKGESLEINSDVVYNRQLKIIASAAGLNKAITSHAARHTFGTWMIMAGVPEIILSKIMGHKKIETTRRYTHIAEKIKSRAIMMGEGQFQKFIRATPD